MCKILRDETGAQSGRTQPPAAGRQDDNWTISCWQGTVEQGACRGGQVPGGVLRAHPSLSLTAARGAGVFPELRCRGSGRGKQMSQQGPGEDTQAAHSLPFGQTCPTDADSVPSGLSLEARFLFQGPECHHTMYTHTCTGGYTTPNIL